jgi:hypothetical protein
MWGGQKFAGYIEKRPEMWQIYVSLRRQSVVTFEGSEVVIRAISNQESLSLQH